MRPVASRSARLHIELVQELFQSATNSQQKPRKGIVEESNGLEISPYLKPGGTSACDFGEPFYRDGMSEHKVTLTWSRGDVPFEYQKYPRDHTWKFDGGHEMQATAAPAYLGNPKNVDPEEAFVAALSSCHMLTFLAVACKKKFVLDEYSDDAVGMMEKNAEGKLAITKVTLRPKLKFSGEKQPTDQELDEMHHFAHDQCFIANSVKTEVTVEK
jgi:organic hydroperoxide reductase OsmC/OhrA